MASKTLPRHVQMRDEHADEHAGAPSLATRWLADIEFEREYGDATDPAIDPAADPVKKPVKKPVGGLVASVPLVYGLHELAPEHTFGHTLCDLLTFCRNPLHPGPCKGWKHSLKAVAPGLHAQIEQRRIERVHARRAEKTAAAAAEGKAAPRFRKLRHEREQPAADVPAPDEPVISPDRQKRLDQAAEKTRKAFDRKGQGKGRDGDGDGLKGEGKYEPVGEIRHATIAEMGLKDGDKVLYHPPTFVTKKKRNGLTYQQEGPPSREGVLVTVKRDRAVATTGAPGYRLVGPNGEDVGGGPGGASRKWHLSPAPKNVDLTPTAEGEEMQIQDPPVGDPEYVGPSDVVNRIAELRGRRIELEVSAGLKTRKIQGVIEDARHINGGTATEIKLEGRVKPLRLSGGFLLPDKPGKAAGGGGGPVADPDAPMVLKGPAQREALGRVVRAGDAGYDNKLGRLNARDRRLLVDNGLAEQGPDGRWRATGKGKATHEASIPRRNGEYVSGIDGLTDSERQAKEERARGEEAKRLEAQRKEQFVRGIPGPGDRAALARYSGPSAMRTGEASRKIATALQKDLGETSADWGATVTPAARDWDDKMRTVDQRAAESHALLERANFLLAAQKADPEHADEYKALYDANKADQKATNDAWTQAVADANAARDALAAAIVERYRAKGKRKTAAALKLPEARRDNVWSSAQTADERIRAANDKADAQIKGLDHNLEPWQVERARNVRDDYTRSVVELEKATADRQAAQDEDRRARNEVSRLLGSPAIVKQGDAWREDKAAADAAAKAAARRYETADERYRSVVDWNRRADAVLVDTVANLRAEQTRNGGPKPEGDVEKIQRLSREAAERARAERQMLEAELGVMSTPKLRAEAKRLGVEPARGESNESLIKKVIPLRERESVRSNPPGDGPDVDPDVRAQLAGDALARMDRDRDTSLAGVELARATAAGEIERGGIPYARAVAAQRVGERRGWDIRTSEGMEKYRELLGLPARPKGTGPSGLTTQEDMDREGWSKIEIPLSDVRFGDSLGGLSVTSWSEPDAQGRIGVNGLGMLGMDVQRPRPATDKVTVWRKVGT